MTDELTSLSATALARAIRRGEASSVEAVSAYLDRIARLNPDLNAIVHLDPDAALRSAARADATRPVGPLHGVPLTLKDCHRVAGMPTIVGNPEAPGRPAVSDGFVAARLRAAGAILVGKTNVPRDLADFQTDNPVHGRTNHPLDPALTPGGSSGGAAAALAAHLTPIEVGSDIAGSIRLPAHFCGVIGLKPTFGAVSLRGHVSAPVEHPGGGGVGVLASIGPMARTFEDVRLVLGVLGVPAGGRRVVPAGLRIGVIDEFAGLRVASAIREAVGSLAARAANEGAKVDRVDLAALRPAEQHRAWVDVYQAATRYGRGWQRLTSVWRAREAARSDWDSILRRFDAILMPPAMVPAFTHRPTGVPVEVDGVPTPYWGLARYTEPFNLTGHPAIVFPAGSTVDGLPIGVQLVAAAGRDRWLLHTAARLASLP